MEIDRKSKKWEEDEYGERERWWKERVRDERKWKGRGGWLGNEWWKGEEEEENGEKEE